MKKALSRKNLWEKTPPLLKSTLGRGLGLIPPKWLLGKSFRANCRFIRDAQWWPAEHAREYQLNKLREVLKLAYERTKFYRRMFDSTGFHPDDFHSLEDMNRLPTIDKQVVVDNLSDMCTKCITAPDVDYGSTGGTSGTPLQFYMNAGRSYVEYAYLTASWERVGYKLGMPMVVLRGRMVKPDRNGFHHEYDPILRHHYYSNFHMTDDYMGLYLKHIRGIGQCMFHAYPSSAQAFAKYIIGRGEPAPRNIKGVLLESENVYADQVADIEQAFSARTFSSYGHSEKLVFAAQCEYSRNYHVWPTYGYFELLDAKDRPIQEVGQEGEILGTSFINTVVPFIRYRTGDYATYVGECCEACGREHIIISDIEGRWPQGGLIATDGSVISMTALNVHDDTFRNVREYQFHQTTPGRAELYVLPNGPLEEKEQRRIISNLHKMLQGQVVLNLKIRNELMKTSRGKRPRVIQRCQSTELGRAF